MHRRPRRDRRSNSAPSVSQPQFSDGGSSHARRIEDATEAVPVATAVTCDRRLSRAARELARQHFVTALTQTSRHRHSNSKDHPHADWNVWQLLEYYVWEGELASSGANCLAQLDALWDPQRDIWKLHEEQSREISYKQARREAGVVGTVRSSAVLPGSVHGSAANSGSTLDSLELHQCGLCGKTFLSRYYLDRHLDARHTNTDTALDSTRICPADAWCRLLSDLTCHEVALELEPWYGPGSNGRGPDHRAVHHALSRSVPPCRTADLAQTRHTCRRFVTDCQAVGGQPAETIADEATSLELEDVSSQRVAVARAFWEGLCGPEQTCQQRLHQKTQRAGSFLEDWVTVFHDVERDHHRLGVGGLITLVVVLLYYGHSFCTSQGTNKRTRILSPLSKPTHRILSRGRHRPGTTILPPPPTTVIDIATKRNKQS